MHLHATPARPRDPQRGSAALLALCALALGACANTLQDEPVAPSFLEPLVDAGGISRSTGSAAPFGGCRSSTSGATPAGPTRSSTATAPQGGENVCVTPLQIVTSPDNSFRPGGSTPQRRDLGARRAEHGRPGRPDDRGVDRRGRRGHLRRTAPRSRAPRPRTMVSDQRRRAARRAAAARRCRTRASRRSRCSPSSRRRAPAPRRAASQSGSGRTAIVMRVTAQRRSLVIAEAHVPHPGGATAVQPRRVRVHDPVRHGPQEARVVGEAHRGRALLEHRHGRRQRRHRLGHRRVDAAVDQARGLLELVAHDRPARAPRSLGDLQQLRGRSGGRIRAAPR